MPYSQNIQTIAKFFDNSDLATSRGWNLGRDDRSMASILRRQSPHWLAGAHSGRGIEAAATSKLLCSVAIVVPQQTTKPLTAFDFAMMLANFLTPLDDRVTQALMILLPVIMRHVLADDVAKMVLTEENELVEALVLDAGQEDQDDPVLTVESRTRLSSPSEHEDLLAKHRILGHQLRAGPECIDGGDAGQRCRSAGGPCQVDSVPTKSAGAADDGGSHGLDQTGWYDGLLSHREGRSEPWEPLRVKV